MADLDRRLTLRISVEGVSEFGEYEETTDVYDVWGQLLQDGVARNVEQGGTYGLAARTWRVRFDQRFLTAHEKGQTITVVSGTEGADIVTGIGEPTPRGEKRRRRFLDLVT